MDVRPGVFVITPDETILGRLRGAAEPCLGGVIQTDIITLTWHIQDSGHSHFHRTSHNFIVV